MKRKAIPGYSLLGLVLMGTSAFIAEVLSTKATAPLTMEYLCHSFVEMADLC